MSETQSSTDISPKLKQIAKLAQDKPGVALMTLAHHIDVNWLREAWRRTRKDGATGIDGVDAEEYGKQLEANLSSLLDRAKSGAYRAPPVRRVHIPKGDGVETRAIGIPTFEDKVLQRAVAMMLEAVYEQSFYDFSYGFRPGRSPHQALEEFRTAAMKMGGGWIVEVDIKKFFDTLDHGHLQAILRQRVRDGVLLRLIGKWLNAGVLEGNELSYPSEGTPQGGVISPLLANVFLHEVFDDWFARTVKPRLRGKCTAAVRYADDIAMIFWNEGDAKLVLDLLPARFGSYGLTLHAEKTRLIGFRRPDLAARYGRPRPGTFDLLGFTHHWGLSRNKKWLVKMRTAKGRFSRTLRNLNEWCRDHRHDKLEMQHAALESKLKGHYEYFGISSNSEALWRLRSRAEWIWHKWLSRRSRKPLPWTVMHRILKRYPLPRPHIRAPYVT
jgi:RNA-directed DNA polymerase